MNRSSVLRLAAILLAATPVLARGQADSSRADAVKKLNPFTGDSAAAKAGRELYFRVGCQGCHGGGGGGGICPAVINPDWVYGSDDQTLHDLIKKGGVALGKPKLGEIKFRNASMPGFPQLSDEEIWQLLAYVRSRYKGSPESRNW